MIILSLLEVSTEYWSLAVAVLAILISIGIHFIQRKKKRLSYCITTSTPLLEINKEIGEELEIFYKRKKIDQLHLLEGNLT